MKNIYLQFAVVLALTGCGGQAFTSSEATGTATDDASKTVPFDGGVDHTSKSTGGAAGSDDGDRADAATGGTTSTGGTRGVSTGGTSTGGAAVDACALVTHTTGLGQTWQDCVPLDTYDYAEAMKACTAAGDAECFIVNLGLNDNGIRGYNAAGSKALGLWAYEGDDVGYVDPAGDWPVVAASQPNQYPMWH